MAACSSKPVELQSSTFVALVGVCMFLAACGAAGGANSEGGGTGPMFLSTPGMAASQGSTYTYQIQTSPPANTIALALATAPAGATLSGSTITWTPTAAQSRLPNQFSVMATIASGSSTQSWSVTPDGTVAGTWVDTYWTSSGPVPKPFDWTRAVALFLPTALVPQPDGSFKEIQGSGNSDGTFSIPNVPGGYYWLQLGIFAYWTSSSTFDFGSDLASQAAINVLTSSPTTVFDFNVSGLDPLQTGDEVVFMWDKFGFPFTLPFGGGSPAGATTLNLAAIVASNIDFSQPNPGFVLQYEPETFGDLTALKLGPQETFPALSFVNGASNTVNSALAPSPQESFDLNIKGSTWASLFMNAGPSTATQQGADLEIMAQPFMTAPNVVSTRGINIPLLVDLQPSSPPTFELLTDPSIPVCGDSYPILGSFNFLPGEPPVTTDQDFGPVQYGDPFPSAWPRIFTFCQTATVQVPIPNSATPGTFRIVDKESSSIPTSQISPPFGPVQNPTINGASIFSSSTPIIGSTANTLSWTAPSGATPTGYEISAFALGALPGGGSGNLGYLPRERYFTAKTSALLPALQAGQTYVFLITTVLDGAANFETRPNRSALPTASVSVVSGPVIINGGP